MKPKQIYSILRTADKIYRTINLLISFKFCLLPLTYQNFLAILASVNLHVEAHNIGIDYTNKMMFIPVESQPEPSPFLLRL